MEQEPQSAKVHYVLRGSRFRSPSFVLSEGLEMHYLHQNMIDMDYLETVYSQLSPSEVLPMPCERSRKIEQRFREAGDLVKDETA